MTSQRVAEWVPRAWATLLAVLLLGPVLLPGYVLSYDMVWVPDLTLRPDFLGVGSALPRAVPSDAMVAVLDEVVPGMLLQKAVLLAALIAAGLGATRLVPDLPLGARLVCLTVYEWNPFVAERLVIGHWPVLIGYAALPWIVVAARRWRLTGQLPPGLAALLLVGSLSAGAGVASGVLLVATAAERSVRRWLTLLGLLLAANAPWLVSGLIHSGSAVTDAAGAEVFALSGEGPLPAPLAALTLGGIWNADVVPGSRDSPLAWLSVVVLVAVLAGGARRWVRTPDDSARVALAAGIGLVIALATWLAPGVVGDLVSTIPGAGVVRDGSRLLALMAPAWAALAGCAAAALIDRIDAESRMAVAAACAVVPLLMLPDAAIGVSGQLHAVDFPDDYASARSAIADRVGAGAPGDVLLLPLSSYRQPTWNRDHPVLDPVGRYLTPDYVASDELVVLSAESDGDTGRTPVLIGGEDPRVPQVRNALAESTPESRAEALARLGIGLVVVDPDGPGRSPAIRGAVVTPVGAEGLQVIELPGAQSRPVPTRWIVLMSLAWSVYLLVPLLLGSSWLARRRARSDEAARRRGDAL